MEITIIMSHELERPKVGELAARRPLRRPSLLDKELSCIIILHKVPASRVVDLVQVATPDRICLDFAAEHFRRWWGGTIRYEMEIKYSNRLPW
jgi:hypothetical protein